MTELEQEEKDKRLTNTSVNKLMTRPKPYEKYDIELKGFLVRVQPSGRKTYFYSYTCPLGKRQRIKLGKHGDIASPQARDKALKLAAEVLSGVNVQAKKKEAIKESRRQMNRTLGSYIDNHLEDMLLATAKSGKDTVRNIRFHFSEYMNVPMDQITIPMLRQFQLEKKKQGLKPATINRVVYSLRSVLSHAKEDGLIDIHPLTGLKPLNVPDNKIIRYLSPDEEKRLLTALHGREQRIREDRVSGNQWRKERGYELFYEFEPHEFVDHIKPMVILSLLTGIRRGELFSIQWSDIDFNNRMLTVRAENAKNSRVRHINLHSTALVTLKQWRNQTKSNYLVFPNADGEPFDNIKKAWKAVLEEAEIKNFRWHDIRHDFASKLVMKGVDLLTVSELLGHRDIKTTQRYAHLAPEHKATAIEKLELAA